MTPDLPYALLLLWGAERVRSTARGGFISLAFLKERRTTKATEEWRKDIIARNRGKKGFRNPTAGEKPRIRAELRRAPRGVASRFYQLESGHTMVISFLKGEFRFVLVVWNSEANQGTSVQGM